MINIGVYTVWLSEPSISGGADDSMWLVPVGLIRLDGVLGGTAVIV